MIVLIFDLDDTILMSNTYSKYSDIKPDEYMKYILDGINCKKFIYTNGTYGHGVNSLNALQLNKSFEEIYARDTLPYMKPYFQSFNEVQNILYYKHNTSKNDKYIFFDDMPQNLETAKRIGWITIWIHPEGHSHYNFVDYAFKDIYNALIFIKSKININI